MGRFFCVKCQEYTDTEDEKIVRTKNNRKMRKGICNTCGYVKTQFTKSN